MNQEVINLSLSDMALSYGFILITIILTSLNGINRNRDIIISVLRMTVQLAIAGFILVYIFDSKSLIFSLLMILFMEASAIYNIVRPIKNVLPKTIIPVIIFAMLISSLASLLAFVILVIRPEPLYNPQYLIPIAGMIVGNTMSAIALALKAILSSIENQRTKIEGSLMLGAKPYMAMDEINKDAFDLAIMPNLNSMKNMGLISLPGMMTGQILGGVVPTVAIKYQISVMIAITSAVTIGVFIFLKFSTNKFFNEEIQLIDIESKKRGKS